ncbi:MAG TPA: hypothetical protein VE890_12160 [Thermoguttaceae bacterium]|nr:hypothetical protein [Thermoguttaceae bacterium]
MTETLQEFVDSRGASMQVDAETGVIRGVKILGLTSRNGRTYLPEALSGAASLYENAKVNVNHPKGNPAGPRDYQDRIGSIRNVVVRPGEGLFADFHFNPKHAMAEQLAWDARHEPRHVGFSHNVQARIARRGQAVVVEAITKVQSVDLVADPATTAGLFESHADGHKPNLTTEGDTSVSPDDLRRDHPAAVKALVEEHVAEIDRLRCEVRRLAALESAQQKQTLIRRLLREFHLPDPESDDPQSRSIITDRFLQSLLAADDERTIRDAIEERAALVCHLSGDPRSPHRRVDQPRPCSRDQYLVDAIGGPDTRAFVDAIT